MYEAIDRCVVWMNPRAFDVADEDLGRLDHAVARVKSALRLELQDDAVPTNDLEARRAHVRSRRGLDARRWRERGRWSLQDPPRRE